MIAVDEFRAAQSRLLERYRVDAASLFIEVSAVRGRVHVLRSGTGPPVVMVPGFADPAAMWAPLMARLEGFTLPLPLRLLSIPALGRFILAVSPPSRRQVETFGRKVGGEDLSKFPELRDLLVAAQKLPGAQDAILGLLHSVVRLRGARPEVRFSKEQLGQIRHPVLLIWGSRDAFGGPSVAEGAAQTIPDGELCIVPGAGHIPWVGHPGEVSAAAVSFLRRQAAR